MGTELEWKSYLPEHCPTGHLGKDTDNLWPIYYEETGTDANYLNGYYPRYTKRYCGYNKEILKRTMLKHEAVFRAQVYELHRLYRIQRDLMDGLKRKAWSSQPNPASLCMALNDRLKLSASAAYPDEKFQPKFLQNKCLQYSPITTESSCVSPKEPAKSSKMVIDLQLPADSYIEENVGNGKVKAIFNGLLGGADPSNYDIEPENCVGLTLSSNEHSGGEHWRMDLKLQNGLKPFSSNQLNELTKVACYDKPSDLSSSRFGNGNLQDFEPSSIFCDLHRNVLQEKGQNVKNLSAFSCIDEAGKQQEWTFSKDESGYCGAEVKTFFGKKIPTLLELKQFNFLRSINLSSTPLSNVKEPSSMETMTRNSQLSERHCLSSTSYPECSVPPASGHLSVQGIHSFSESEPMDVQSRSLISAHSACNPGEKWKFDGSRPQNVESKVSIPHDELFHESRPDINAPSDTNFNTIYPDKENFNDVENSSYAKSESQEAPNCIKGWNDVCQRSKKEINLAPILPRFSQQKAMNGTLESKILDSSTRSWLRSDAFCRESAELEVTYKDMQDETPGISGSKYNFGVSAGGKTSIACTSIDTTKRSFHPCNSSETARSIDLEEPKLDKPVSFGGFGCNALSYMRDINLNLDVTCSEEPKLLDTLQPPLPNDVKSVRTIDLELPAECPVEDNYIVGPTATVDCPQEREPLNNATTLSAAEIIVSISSHMCRRPDANGCHLPTDSASHDTLQWFAGLVCTNACDVSSIDSDVGFKGNDSSSSDYDGMDYFEAMTLKLTDARFNDHTYKPPEHKSGKCLASMSLMKIKRGQTRKRRQRRDFQKTIWPGLASLSRHEVNEDLQMIGGMMRSSGQHWQASVARRTATRDGGNNCHRRGLPRGTSMAIYVEEAPLDLPKGKPKNSEVTIDTTSLMGWGRTRRCRRLRHPSGSPAAALSNLNA